uniref:MULE transposase domain-containing protein n=1 Tax=Cucumis melo TaxID=3656 RepID=A0A9I9EG98_CUCME
MSTDRFIPKEIVHNAPINLGVSISYQKSWRGKEHMVKILQGDAIESYALIPRFFDKLVEFNRCTCTALEINDSGHFKFFFMAFAALIEGWKYCRPIISVDETFLKCKFGGILLTTSLQDGNNQNFPLAFAIVDSENDISW